MEIIDIYYFNVNKIKVILIFKYLIFFDRKIVNVLDLVIIFCDNLFVSGCFS